MTRRRHAGITKPFRPFHDLRHTALTHERGRGREPDGYVQLKAGHSQNAITERYIHAAQVMFPGAVARGEVRMFGASSTAYGGQTTDLGAASPRIHCVGSRFRSYALVAGTRAKSWQKFPLGPALRKPRTG